MQLHHNIRLDSYIANRDGQSTPREALHQAHHTTLNQNKMIQPFNHLYSRPNALTCPFLF